MGYLSAAFFYQRGGEVSQRLKTLRESSGYWFSLLVGVIFGAYLFGSVNMSLASTFRLGHSIAGALVGGIITTEIYKWKIGYRESTGAPFVLSLFFGIGVGRLGCFFAGIPDYTYGIETRVFWAVNFGDGILRHPVQLYESITMFVGFALFFLFSKHKNYSKVAFYYFCFYYGLQRFIWEFLKPYPKVMGPFNLFHFACMSIIAYSIFQLVRANAFSTQRS